MDRNINVALVIFSLLAATISTASAETQEEQGPCVKDAIYFCSAAILDRDRILACLLANSDHISAACRALISRKVSAGWRRMPSMPAVAFLIAASARRGETCQ